MISTKKHLPRRTVLRGLGATLALPLLDAMVPAHTALAKTAAAPQLRIGFVYVPNGIIMEQWTPAEPTGFVLGPILRPLEPLRDQVTVISGLGAQETTGQHAVSTATWLNDCLPKKTEGGDVLAGTTIDQIIAARIGSATPFRSFELATEDATRAIGACDVGYSCAYMNTISWLTPTTPLAMEINPRVVFERMFGNGSTAAERVARSQRARSILDSVHQEVQGLRARLGARDVDRLDAYTESLREVERRIQASASRATRDPLAPAIPVGVPESFADHVALLLELQRLALQADLTRVFTFMMARELSERVYPQAGVTQPHHFVSHHQNDRTRIDQHARINTYHVQILANFLDGLRQTPDGDGSLLDQSMIVYGSGMSNGDIHSHDPLPMLIAGGAAGRLQGGRHVRLPAHTPLRRFLLTVMDLAGVSGTPMEANDVPLAL